MIDIEQLRIFLKNQSQHTWAADPQNVESGRSGFKDLEYRERDWCIRDSYAGYYQAPGMSVVYYKKRPVWTVAYSGKVFENKYAYAREAFDFLKRALKRKDLKSADDLPVRGPANYVEGDWLYKFNWHGDLKCFHGQEKIFYRKEEIFYQDIMGGFIIGKNWSQDQRYFLDRNASPLLSSLSDESLHRRSTKVGEHYNPYIDERPKKGAASRFSEKDGSPPILRGTLR
jgi:hypothetical protein